MFPADDSNYNPFNGVSPNFDFFGAQLHGALTLLLGGVWGLAIIVTGFLLIVSIFHVRHVNNTDNPQLKEKARGRLIGAIFTVVAVVCLPLIFGAILIAAGKV